MSWTHLQSASNDNNSATSVSVTLTSNVSSGSKLIVAVAGWINAPGTVTASVKDGAGNSWTKLTSEEFGDNEGELSFWALDTPSGDVGTTPTITATAVSGTPAWGILVQEVSGLLPGNTTAMLDGSVASINGSGASEATGSPTYSSTVADEYLVAVYGDDAFGGAFTGPGSPWTNDAANLNNTGIEDLGIAYTNSTGGTETDGYTTGTGNQGWALMMVAFQLPPVGPTITTTSLPNAPINNPYSATLQATGGATPYTWSISSGSLPSWASLNSSSGVISGTPAMMNVGTTSFTVEVTDNNSNSNTQPLSLTVTSMFSLESALPGFPAPGSFVPGQLIINVTTQHHTATLAALIAGTAKPARSVDKFITGVTTAAGSARNSIARILVAALTVTASIVAAAFHRLTFTGITGTSGSTTVSRLREAFLIATAAATASAQRTVGRALSASTVVKGVLGRTVTRTLAATLTVESMVSRQVTRTFTVVTAVTGVVSATRVKLITLTGAIAPTVTVSREIFKTLTGGAGISSLVTRVIRRNVTGTVTGAGQVKRSITRTLLTAVAATGRVSRGIAKHITTFVTATGSILAATGEVIRTLLLQIVLPGGGYKRVTSNITVLLPTPEISLSAFIGTVSTISVQLPELQTSFTGFVSTGLKIVLPPLKTSFTGRPWHADLSIVLPSVQTDFNGVHGINSVWNVEFGETPLRLVREFLGIDAPNEVGEPPTWSVAPLRVNWKTGVSGVDWTVAFNGASINHLGTEYLLVPVQAIKAGVPFNPTGDVVQFAFAATPNYVPQPSDWVTGSWDTDPASILYPYNAKCLIGPNGVKTLTPGDYQVYIQITDNPETPVLIAGILTIT
jgi:Putative Ig domain